VTIYILLYWEDQPVTAARAVEHVREVRKKVADIFVGKEVWIGEVGWPSERRMRDGALPSPANQALVLSGVVEAANAESWKVNPLRPSTSLGSGCWKAPLAVVAGCSATLRGSSSSMALGLPMEPPEPGDRLRSAGMIVLSLLVPMVAAGAVAQNAPLGNLAVALNTPLRRHVDGWSVGLAVLFAATLVAAIHVVLGLVFDPRYKDFQLALLSGPVAALAIVAFLKEPVRGVGCRWPYSAARRCLWSSTRESRIGRPYRLRACLLRSRLPLSGPRTR
jgi:hypothetical protein